MHVNRLKHEIHMIVHRIFDVILTFIVIGFGRSSVFFWVLIEYFLKKCGTKEQGVILARFVNIYV